MDPIKVQLTREKETLLPTLYGKALDNRAEHPILGDKYADAVLRRIDYDFAKLRLGKNASVSLPLRAKHLDGWTREFLAENPHAVVLHLGCGLDSRVFRIDPPATVAWYDIDYPEVIELRQRLYPERRDYVMIGASVTDPKWLAAVPTDRPVLVVAEGLVQYLSEETGVALFRRICERFPSGQIVFDAYSRLMNRMIGLMPAAKEMGISLTWALDEPRLLEERIPRLKLISEVPFLSMPELVARLSASRIQRAIYDLLARTNLMRHAIRHLRYRF